VCAVIGVPARASGSCKELLLKMAHQVVDVAMVISEPFMVAYAEDKLLNSIVVDIGAGTTDICALRGRLPMPEDQATLLKAGNYLDERIAALIQEHYPSVQININIAREIKEQKGFVFDAAAEVIADLREDGRPVALNVTDDVRVACESIIPDIIHELDELVRCYQPDQQDEVLQNIILAGGGSRVRNLANMIEDKLRYFGDVKVSRIEDPDYAGCHGGLNMASELPPEYWSQMGDMIGM